MPRTFDLKQDRRGMFWDLLLYVPTVSALAGFAGSSWYAHNEDLAYLLSFMACFFFLAGSNRILKTRLMWLPSAPVRIEADEQAPYVRLTQKNGLQREILKNIKVHKEVSGRSLGLTGLGADGKQLQFIFHKGQFSLENDYLTLQELFKKKP